MNRDAPSDSNSSSDVEQPTRSTTDTYTFLENCVLDADHKALEEHLESNLVQQSDLDRCLFYGLQIVKRKKRELSHVAHTLAILLQFGAKWNSKFLLDYRQTPYHIICESPGDHHELLELMIKLCQLRIIDAEDIGRFTALMYAVSNDNINCFKCLIANGADIKGGYGCGYVWSLVARWGNVELLKCLFNRGIDIDSTDQIGRGVLWWAVCSGNIEAVRYLLDIGVTIPNYAPKVHETQCECCKKDRFVIEYKGKVSSLFAFVEKYHDPCLRAIDDNKLEIVKLLDERGSQSCKLFYSLRSVVMSESVEVASYLLNKYMYPLNIEYIIKDSYKSIGPYTLLTESGQWFTPQITKLLLDHGADPAKPMCAATSVNATMTAICAGDFKAIAQYIRSGVNINFRSYDGTNIKALPFETSVLQGHLSVAKMLLVSGCSCGVFSLPNNHKFKVNIKPDLEVLMKEWKVQENNVIPLKQRCRCVILNHLSPRADMKIENLPLPKLIIIKFLSIPELDVIQDLSSATITHYVQFS